MNEQKGTKAMLRTLGISLIIIGGIYGIFGFLPFIIAASQKVINAQIVSTDSTKTASLRAELERVNNNLRMNRPIWAFSNPDDYWIGQANRLTQLNNQLAAPDEEMYKTTQVIRKAEETMESTGTHAAISFSILIAGIIALLMAKKAIETVPIPIGGQTSFCSYCGAPNSLNGVFCSKCGKPLNSSPNSSDNAKSV